MKRTMKRRISKLIDEYFENKVKVEELSMKGKGITYKSHSFEYWHRCHEFQEAKLEQLKDDAKEELIYLKKLRKILNEYHSQIPQVEIGRQNVLNDIDNELHLDKRIKELKQVIQDD